MVVEGAGDAAETEDRSAFPEVVSTSRRLCSVMSTRIPKPAHLQIHCHTAYTDLRNRVQRVAPASVATGDTGRTRSRIKTPSPAAASPRWTRQGPPLSGHVVCSV